MRALIARSTTFDFCVVSPRHSLAQVHRAWLPDGRKVAVKVQYYDLRERFDADVSTVASILGAVEFFFPKFEFGWILRDLRSTLEKGAWMCAPSSTLVLSCSIIELDFHNEGRNSEQCARDLAPLGDLVHVPAVEWSLTSER